MENMMVLAVVGVILVGVWRTIRDLKKGLETPMSDSPEDVLMQVSWDSDVGIPDGCDLG